MAIIVSTNAMVKVNGTDLSNHVKSVTVDDGQETRDVTAMGNTGRLFRAGLATQSISCTFHNDHLNGSVENTLRALISVASTGFVVDARPVNSAQTTDNPTYEMVAIYDGGLQVMNDSVGDVPEISAKFVPYSSFTVYTSAT